MLAAASAWRILEIEHVRMRQLLAAIARVLEGGAWHRKGPQLERLRHLIRDFQEFETRTHRPKGVVLLGSVRGRSAPADQLLDVLDEESRQCEELLARAVELLEAIDQGGEVDAAEAESLLQQHRDLMMLQLNQEDTVLRSYTAELLTSEEWSTIASSISSVVQRGKGRRVHSRH